MHLSNYIQLAKNKNLKIGKIYEDYFEVLCPFHNDREFGNAFIFISEDSSANFKCFSCGKFVPNFLFKQGSFRKIFLDKTKNVIPFKPKIDYFKYPYVNPNSFEYCIKRGWTLPFVRNFNIRLYTRKEGYCIIPLPKDNYELRKIKEVPSNRNQPKVLYPKNMEKDFIFNQENLDFSKELYVKEGISGIAKIWNHISKNVTATLSSNVTTEQFKILSKFKRIILVPDLDEAGKKMILNFIKNIEEEKLYFVISVDDSEEDFLKYFNRIYSFKEIYPILLENSLKKLLFLQEKELKKYYQN